MAAPAQAVAARSTNDPRPAPLSFEKSAEAFQAADDPVSKARIILQNPEFLEMALKQDAETARSLASLCDSFAQTLSMDSLLRNNAESFPCLRPIVGRGKTLLSPESYDSGPWRIARSPVQFALEHGLLLNKDGQPFTPEQALRRGLAHGPATQTNLRPQAAFVQF